MSLSFAADFEVIPGSGLPFASTQTAAAHVKSEHLQPHVYEACIADLHRLQAEATSAIIHGQDTSRLDSAACDIGALATWRQYYPKPRTPSECAETESRQISVVQPAQATPASGYHVRFRWSNSSVRVASAAVEHAESTAFRFSCSRIDICGISSSSRR